mgnify:CR=1 FL=1
MKRIGIILTPDVRSKAYLSKLMDNKIKLDQIIFMNDNREEKKFSNKEIIQAKLYGIKINQMVNLENQVIIVKLNITYQILNLHHCVRG